jgi:hypothetical protein
METSREVSLQRRANFEILINRKFRRRSVDMADVASEVILETEREKTASDKALSWPWLGKPRNGEDLTSSLLPLSEQKMLPVPHFALAGGALSLSYMTAC